MSTNNADNSWVSVLARRYEQATQELNEANQALCEQLPSLQFAATVLHKAMREKQSPEHAAHVVVMGPTQSGKSTLVNVLLDYRAASVSPLAGFTVHSQGYGHSISEAEVAYVHELMNPFQRIPGDMLDSANLESYVLEPVIIGANALVDTAIVWDTPDFDSITADKYSKAVIHAAALADIIILTVSKDKYGDKRVWDMLELFKHMGKPLLVCINKVNEVDREVVSTAFTRRFIDMFGEPLPPLLILPFVVRDNDQTALPLSQTIRDALQSAVQHALDSVNTAAQSAQCQRFIEHYQAQWLQPLIVELEAREQWLALTLEAIDEAEQYYLLNYLNSPDKYETFNRALAELLTLLEIPGVASTIAQARKAITWPARRLLGVGRDLLGQQSAPARSASGQVLDHEALVLQHILDSTLIKVQRELLAAPSDPWWQALDSQLRAQMPQIRERFDSASESTRKTFEPEIEKAAASLYEQLRKQPALLNTLRAARASADAAGIALAVKSGGLAPTDLILAPAMLSVTTLLTESALGRYLDSIKRDLKQRQRQHIRKHLLDDVLLSTLVTLMDSLDRPELLTGAIEPVLQIQLEAYRDSLSNTV